MIQRFFLILLITVSFFSLSASGERELRDHREEWKNLNGFNSIEIKTAGDFQLIQGNHHRVEIDADPEILHDLVIRVDGQTLIIDKHRGVDFFSSHQIRGVITLPDLEGLFISGSADVISTDQFDGPSLTINITGSGDVGLAVDFKEVSTQQTGSGNLQLDGSITDLGTSMTGSGDLEVSGSGKNLTVKMTGSGDFHGSTFAVQTANFKMTGSGDSWINVSEELNVHLSGSGDLEYRGNPQMVREKTTGSGKVEN